MPNFRSFLVLWQMAEAESAIGDTPETSVGSHMKGLEKGDRIFLTACDGKELYLLGAMRVSHLSVARGGRFRGKPKAIGKTLAGNFQMLPLGNLKKNLRFEKTKSPRLTALKSLLWQVRSRRQLTPQSAALLIEELSAGRRRNNLIRRQFATEGERMRQTVSKRERDPRIRAAAVKAFDYTCTVCQTRPSDRYGDFAATCLDVHHLNPLGSATHKRSPTKLTDVILVCPTCHRALHMSGDPANWRAFRRDCGFVQR